MKSFYLIFILLLGFIHLSPFTVGAQDQEPEIQVEPVQPVQEEQQDDESMTGFCRLARSEKLWSGPSKNFKVVREASEGSLLIIIGEKAGYYRVQVPDGFQCYIAANYLDIDANSVGTVTGNRVNLRSIPGIKGDYPIYQAMGGDKLYVWDRVGEWCCISAPDSAFLYIPKDAVTLVEDSSEVQAEIASLRKQGFNRWESHIHVLQTRMEKEENDIQIQHNLESLEQDAEQNYQNKDLKDTLSQYEVIAAKAQDDKTRSLAKVRADEVKAIMAQKEAEDELKKRERIWREEKKMLVEALDNTKPIKPSPATHKAAGQGRLVTVVGRIHAQGDQVTLMGGKSSADTLWNVQSPDGRYVLPDFHLRRVSIQGRISDVTNRENPSVVVVERIEILN
ncbi:MAG: hypothetical protein ABIK28_17055 [Planctomycetota bacterium]